MTDGVSEARSKKLEPKGSPKDDSTHTGTSRNRVRFIARTGLIAAVHCALTLVVMQFLTVLSWGPVQFRLSEALTVLPLFFAEAVPGLALGTFLANLINTGMTGGAIGLLDVVFGSLATLLGAVWTYRFREKSWALALAGPVVFNALIVPAYLPIIMSAIGYLEFYDILPLNIAISESFFYMYLFGLVAVGFGQALVVYGLGMPLKAALSSIIARHDS